MQPGTLFNPIAAAQVDTPETGVNAFVNILDNTLWGKFPDGSSVSLVGGVANPLASQAVNTGTANALVYTITGVASYASGDTYYVTVLETNTGAVTININGLGVKNVRYKGVLATVLPASTFTAGSTIALIYDGTQFQFIGTVKGSQVISNFNVTYVEATTRGLATATATIDLLYLPPKANLNAAICRPTVIAAAPALTAAVLAFTNVESALNVFGGNIDNFVAPAADKGGVSRGLTSNADIPYQVGTQTYRMVWTLTTDVWNNTTSGEFNLIVAWSPLN